MTNTDNKVAGKNLGKNTSSATGSSSDKSVTANKKISPPSANTQERPGSGDVGGKVVTSRVDSGLRRQSSSSQDTTAAAVNTNTKRMSSSSNTRPSSSSSYKPRTSSTLSVIKPRPGRTSTTATKNTSSASDIKSSKQSPTSSTNTDDASTSSQKSSPAKSSPNKSNPKPKAVTSTNDIKNVPNKDAPVTKPENTVESLADDQLVSKSPEKMSDQSLNTSFSRQISLGDQLIIYTDIINPRSDFDQLQRLLETSLDKQDKQCLSDLKENIIKKEDSWILDVKLLNFVGALLEHRYYTEN